MKKMMTLGIVIICFFLMISERNADCSTCYTGSVSQRSALLYNYGWITSDITFSNFPANAKINYVDVDFAGWAYAYTHYDFYLTKLNSGINSFRFVNNDYTTPVLGTYEFPSSDITVFDNSPVNGVWRLSMYCGPLSNGTSPYNLPGPISIDNWSLEICYDVVPDVPVVTNPINNYSSTTCPTFNWNASANATRYYIQIANDAGFNSIVYQGDVGNYTSYYPFANLPGFGTYYWRVKAGNDVNMWSDYSNPVRSFTWYTALDINPVPLSPKPNVPIFKSDAIITWTPPANGYWDANNNYIYYYVDVATDSSFNNKIINNSMVFGMNNWDISSYVTEGQTYYWRVRASSGGVYGPYGSSNFTINGGFHVLDFNSEFNSFNPYGGGVSTFAADLTFDPSGVSTWTVSVGGRNYNGSGTPAYFTWDGKDDSGKLVNPGAYTATFTARSANGVYTDSKQVSIIAQKPADPIVASCETSLEICTQSSTNIGTGSVSHEQTLFIAKGPTRDLSFTLQYNSLDSLTGTLGIAWTHNYDIALKDAANGSKIFRQGFTKTLYTLSGSTYISPVNNFSTLVKNANGSFTVTQRNGDKYYFDTTGRITSIYSRYAKELGITYSTGLITITDASNRTIKLYTDANNNLATVYDPAGNEYDFYYTGTTNPRLSLVKYPDADNPGNNYWSYTYDGISSRMLTKRDPNGDVTTYTYYPDGRMKDAIDPEGDPAKGFQAGGHTRSMSYDPTNRQTSFYEKDGGLWQNKFDPFLGMLKQSVSPVTGKVTDYFYNSNGSLKAKNEPFSDGKQLTTFYRYDAYGNITDISEPIDFTTVATSYSPQSIDTLNVNTFDNAGSPIKWATRYTYDYASFDDIASVTDLRGSVPLTTTYTHSSQSGLLVTQITAPGKNIGETIISYRRQNANGTMASVTDENGKTTTFAYYPYSSGNWTNYLYNMISSITLPSGIKTSFNSYNKNGNATLTTIKDATGIDIQVNTLKQYDNLNRLKTFTKVTPATTLNYQYGFDMAGNITTFTDPENNVTQYKYNYMGKKTEITDAKQKKTQFLYSGSGCTTCGSGVDQLNTVKDANHVSKNIDGSVYKYDEFGRLKFETDPLSKTFYYTYYDNNLLKTKTDVTGGSNTLLITYLYNTRGQITDKTFTDGTSEHYTYYTNGWLQTAGNQNITYTYNWYNNGWLKDVTDNQGHKISYDDYDATGQRKQVTILKGSGADERLISYDYDSTNRPWHITSNAGIFTYTYDNRSRRNILTYPNNTLTDWDFDDLDRLTAITHKVSGGSAFATFSYTDYDKMGNRKNVSGNKNETYGYDELYRLLNVASGNSEAFTYDAVGNRTTGPSPMDSAYLHNDANQITTGRKLDYGYDNSGNQTNRTIPGAPDKSWVQTWDYNNRLVKAEKIKGSEKRTVTFKYDPFGRRIEKKQTTIIDSVTKTSTWTYVYDNDNIAFEIYTDTTGATEKTWYTHGAGVDEHLALERNSQYYYYHADGLGSIAAITDASHAVAQSYEYESYGMMTPSTGFRNSYTFTGREWDKETGLYYYRARYYDPVEGMFVSKDPSGFSGGINIYAYALGNPIRYRDPRGLDVRVENTAQVFGLHQRITVDTPSGPYSISFGMATRDMPQQGAADASRVAPGPGVPGSGIVYEDTDAPTAVQQTLHTTANEDAAIYRYLHSQVGNTGPYNVGTNSCRTFSNKQFNNILRFLDEAYFAN